MENALLLFVCSLLLELDLTAQNNALLRLWYTHPATQWVEALPVGNGRLGAMVYGDPYRETIQLNESTVWGGQPNRNDNPDSREALSEIRKLVFDGKYKEAQDLVNQKVISKVSNGMPYQTVGAFISCFPAMKVILTTIENSISRRRWKRPATRLVESTMRAKYLLPSLTR
jgi:hypothetical protein